METTIAVLRIALGVITDRLLTVLSLAMTFTLACWAMNQPDIQREAMAGFFALAVFLPCIIRERRSHAQAARSNAQAD